MSLYRSVSARRSLGIFVDQALSSASNFLLVILVARSLTTHDFGTFAIAFSLLSLGLGLTRANLGVPLSIDLPREPSPEVADDAIRRSFAMGILIGAAVGLLVAGLALLVAGPGLRPALLLLAAASPVLVTQDVARSVAVARGTPRYAVASDLVWVVVGLLVLVTSQVTHHIGPVIAAGGWVLGGVLALGMIHPCLRRPSWAGTWHWFARDRRRRHLSLDALTSAMAPLLVVTLVAAISSPATVGSIRGASTLMSPINVAIAAVSLGAVAEISRRPWHRARRFMVLVSAFLAACAVLWATIVWLLPPGVGTFLLGDTWHSARRVVPFSAAEYVGIAAWNGAVALLRASERTRTSAATRVVYLVLTLIATSTAAAAVGTAPSIQIALAASAATVAVFSWVRGWPEVSAGDVLKRRSPTVVE